MTNSEIVKGCRFFRIPFLTTTKKGTVIAGVDLNLGSTGDSADNIDVCMRRRLSGKKDFEPVQVPECLHFTDYADEFGYRQESASYIDGAILSGAVNENGNERIYLMCDAWAWNGGILGRGIAPIAENGLFVTSQEWRSSSDKLKGSGIT